MRFGDLEDNRQEWRDCLKVLKESKIGNPIKITGDDCNIDPEYKPANLSFVDTMSLHNQLQEDNERDWKEYQKTLKESGIKNSISVDEDGSIIHDENSRIDTFDSDNALYESMEEERKLIEESLKDLKINKNADNKDVESDGFFEDLDFSVKNDESETHLKEIQNSDGFSLKEIVNQLGKFKKKTSEDDIDDDYTLYSEESQEEENSYADERKKESINSWMNIKNHFRGKRF